MSSGTSRKNPNSSASDDSEHLTFPKYEQLVVDLVWMLVDWGNWRAGRPRESLRRDAPERVRESRGPFESKPPGLVWMTPQAQIIDYRYIDESYARLQDIPRLVIKRLYLESLSVESARKKLGLRADYVLTHEKKAREGIARGYLILAQHYARGGNSNAERISANAFSPSRSARIVKSI